MEPHLSAISSQEEPIPPYSRHPTISRDSYLLDNMNRVRRLFSDGVAYEPLDDSAEVDAGEHVHDQERATPHFSRLEYSVFFLLGVSMLWAW